MKNISGKFVDRLAEYPEELAGTGLEISSAVFNTLETFVFDTTASNTGRYNGACTLLENKLDRDIIFFSCRHHIFKIILAGIFKKCKISPMTGPDIPLFKQFKAKWNTINLNKFVTGISNIDIKNAFGNNYIDILNYDFIFDMNKNDYTALIKITTVHK
ncbi:Uncharacterized protein FWK35_00015453 [Aphis craccivora]|uniref:Uncharacterized protein n=1 Tax=Aphis craccivora TaxID=307492 RepID=A0A6G0Y0J2_APHCR|nr:Uncharacterized protein FWK35_00015453 [Aphis craccivora]